LPILGRSFAKSLSKVLNTLRKRTFTHPWAIVRQNPLNSAVDTEDVNVRPAPGDRSLPRQAPEDERSSPGHTYTLARGRTFTQHWAIVRPRGNLFSRDLFRSQSPLTHHFPYSSTASPLRRKVFSAHRLSSHLTTPPPPPQITHQFIPNHHKPPQNTISGHPIPLQSPIFQFPLFP
jgi:hypothetical protein